MIAQAKSRQHAGVIAELLDKSWQDPKTGLRHGIPIDSIVIADSLAGIEADLVHNAIGNKSVLVVHDEFTRVALGERVMKALAERGTVDEFVWPRPKCTDAGIAEILEAGRHADAIISVGSGTVSDSVKYATFKSDRPFCVFATSPMNAFTTPTVSLTVDGMKTSLTTHSARGVFFDLEVLGKCPIRLRAAAFADVICRTTSQVDWLMSHLLLNTAYSDVAYTLLAYDEDAMIAAAAEIAAGDLDSLATLTRVSAIMGLTTSFTGTSHVGSMAEHMISHHIDMFAGDLHPRSSHGEQVGVATLSVSKLQNDIIGADKPPVLSATEIPEQAFVKRFGASMAATMVAETRKKAFDREAAAAMNQRLEAEWPDLRAKLRPIMRPCQDILDAMRAAKCKCTAEDLGLDVGFYQEAIRYSRFIRDRFSILDIAGDSGQLDSFAETCH